MRGPDERGGDHVGAPGVPVAGSDDRLPVRARRPGAPAADLLSSYLVPPHDVDTPVAELEALATATALHAPLLDLDVSCEMTAHAGGQRVLWVDGLGHSGWRVAADTLRAAGLGGVPDWAAGLTDRTSAAQLRALRSSGQVDQLDMAASAASAAAGRSWPLPASEAVKLAGAASWTADARPAPPTGLREPWPLHIAGESLLVASGTAGHFHLYLGSAMPWDALLTLLEGLVAATLLEAGFVAGARASGAVFLRTPWAAKHADGVLRAA